jgi:hypothetical protein
VQLDRGRLGFATPARCRELLPDVGIPCTPFIAAVGLVNPDPMTTRSCLSGHGIGAAVDADDLVYIPAMEAQGATLVVHPPDVEWPPAAG